MSQETLNAVLIFVGAVIVALIWILDRSNKRAADSLPPETVTILRAAVGALEALASKTPNTLDDQVIALLHDLLGPEPPAEDA